MEVASVVGISHFLSDVLGWFFGFPKDGWWLVGSSKERPFFPSSKDNRKHLPTEDVPWWRLEEGKLSYWWHWIRENEGFDMWRCKNLTLDCSKSWLFLPAGLSDFHFNLAKFECVSISKACKKKPLFLPAQQQTQKMGRFFCSLKPAHKNHF